MHQAVDYRAPAEVNFQTLDAAAGKRAKKTTIQEHLIKKRELTLLKSLQDCFDFLGQYSSRPGSTRDSSPVRCTELFEVHASLLDHLSGFVG